METYLDQRPSVLTPASALVPSTATAHASVVGQPAVWRACKPRTTQESVQSIHTQVPVSREVQLALALTPDHGTNGFVAPNSGMAASARKGGKASGIPPRERQV